MDHAPNPQLRPKQNLKSLTGDPKIRLHLILSIDISLDIHDETRPEHSENPSHAFMTENLRYQTFLTSDTCLMNDIPIMTTIIIVTLD